MGNSTLRSLLQCIADGYVLVVIYRGREGTEPMVWTKKQIPERRLQQGPTTITAVAAAKEKI